MTSLTHLVANLIVLTATADIGRQFEVSKFRLLALAAIAYRMTLSAGGQ